MAELNYAFIKGVDVINVVVFDSLDETTYEHFKTLFDLDDIILATEKTAIGGTYDGTNFWFPQPYPSWVKNHETNDWDAPVPLPEDRTKFYSWDEDTLSWIETPIEEPQD